jgi:hypothetical protein
MEDRDLETQLCTSAEGPRKRTRAPLTESAPASAEFLSYTPVLPSGGASAIATCTALENACCLHTFEDAEIA